jgi:hypothetical protein
MFFTTIAIQIALNSDNIENKLGRNYMEYIIKLSQNTGTLLLGQKLIKN